MRALSSLLAGTALLVALPAFAQDYGYGPPPGSEEVQVYAPRIHVEPNKMLDGAPEKLSMQVNVRYDDLDLRTPDGAHELRYRVREAARNVCQQLRDAYPYAKMPGTSCYKDAVESALVHADEAIRDARYYGYED